MQETEDLASHWSDNRSMSLVGVASARNHHLYDPKVFIDSRTGQLLSSLVANDTRKKSGSNACDWFSILTQYHMQSFIASQLYQLVSFFFCKTLPQSLHEGLNLATGRNSAMKSESRGGLLSSCKDLKR